MFENHILFEVLQKRKQISQRTDDISKDSLINLLQYFFSSNNLTCNLISFNEFLEKIYYIRKQ